MLGKQLMAVVRGKGDWGVITLLLVSLEHIIEIKVAPQEKSIVLQIYYWH
jgi:hypothetical protein